MTQVAREARALTSQQENFLDCGTIAVGCRLLVPPCPPPEIDKPQHGAYTDHSTHAQGSYPGSSPSQAVVLGARKTHCNRRRWARCSASEPGIWSSSMQSAVSGMETHEVHRHPPRTCQATESENLPYLSLHWQSGSVRHHILCLSLSIQRTAKDRPKLLSVQAVTKRKEGGDAGSHHGRGAGLGAVSTSPLFRESLHTVLCVLGPLACDVNSTRA
jgi:hypothetical protein